MQCVNIYIRSYVLIMGIIAMVPIMRFILYYGIYISQLRDFSGSHFRLIVIIYYFYTNKVRSAGKFLGYFKGNFDILVP